MKRYDDPVEQDWKSFGEWVEEKQRACRPKVTDVELARRVGITRQHLGVIKKGESGTKKPVIISIANALGADPNEACEITGFKGIRPDEPDLWLARRLISVLRNVPKEQRRMIEGLLVSDAEQYVALLESKPPPGALAA